MAMLALALLAAANLSPAEQSAVFAAAGFRSRSGQWRSCEDPSASYAPGKIEVVRDLNGDGLPEAIVTEGSGFCYGNTGTAFWLVGKQPDGRWKLLFNASGIPEFLGTRGPGGWPDLSVGGPGFCFPVLRWNGRAYDNHRLEYQGKPCRH